MSAELTIPKDRAAWLALRAKNLNSTETAALFDASPYTTSFELFHQKREGAVVEIATTERMLWGTRLQDAIARGIAEDQGWDIRPMPEYMRIPELRLGSSFDYAIGDEGLLEVKNVDSLAYRAGWLIEDGKIEAPPHIEIQVQHQLAVSGRKYAWIGALVGGNEVVLVKREPDSGIIDAIMTRAAAFWADVDAGREPKPDFKRDAEFIARLYQFAEPGKVIDARSDEAMATLALKYRQLGERAREIEQERDAVKAEILTRVGDAERVNGDGWTLSAGVVGPAQVAYERKAYRAFKMNWKKS